MSACEKTINIELNADQPAGFLDIAQCLSRLNRKMYRQGMQYMIQEIRVNSYSAGATELQIFRMPDTWVTTNAWVKALAEWNEQHLQAARETGTESMRAKWRDFKVFMNEGHITAGGTNNLLPEGFGLTNVSAGTVTQDWNASLLVVPNEGGTAGNTQEFYLHMLGDDITSPVDSKGLVKAYAQSRARPNEPVPNVVAVDGGLYTDIENVGEDLEEVIDNFATSNNSPPYPLTNNTIYENYPGGAVVGTPGYENKGHKENVAPLDMATPGSFRTLIPGFVAPLGLLYIGAGGTISGSETVNVQIICAPGKYQGVLAQSMKVAN
jgi:hypothetical protein